MFTYFLDGMEGCMRLGLLVYRTGDREGKVREGKRRV